MNSFRVHLFLVHLLLITFPVSALSETEVVNARYGNFFPGHAVGASAELCHKVGGNMPQGSNCNLGRVLAVYRCDNDVMVSVIHRPEDQAILHWTGSRLEHADLLTSGGGARWVGKRLVVWERGPEARVVAPAWESRCSKL